MLYPAIFIRARLKDLELVKFTLMTNRSLEWSNKISDPMINRKNSMIKTPGSNLANRFRVNAININRLSTINVNHEVFERKANKFNVDWPIEPIFWKRLNIIFVHDCRTQEKKKKRTVSLLFGESRSEFIMKIRNVKYHRIRFRTILVISKRSDKTFMPA